MYFLLIAPCKELNPARVGASGQFQLFFIYIYIKKINICVFFYFLSRLCNVKL